MSRSPRSASPEAVRPTTDADGRVAVRAEVPSLAPGGRFDFCVAKPGYVPQHIVLRPADDRIVLARSATVCGRVRSPIAGGAIAVVATTSSGAQPLLLACDGCEPNTVMRRLPAAGPFRLEVPTGSYRLWADVASIGTTPTARFELRPGATVDLGTLELALPVASLSGVVRDPAGKPSVLRRITLQRSVTGLPGQPLEARRTLELDSAGRFLASRLPEGAYRIGYGDDSKEIVLPRGGLDIELRHDPGASRICDGCGPAPVDPATYDGPWLPSLDLADDTIEGPKRHQWINRALAAPLAPGLLPGDVLEQSDGKPGAEGLAGRHDTPVVLRIFRPGTGQHLSVTVRRTVPAVD